MSKSKKNIPITIRSTDPATSADLKLAIGLIPSTRKVRGWTAVGTLIETFSNAKMQASLRTVKPELGVLGIDIEEILSAADEGAALIAALSRLDESTGRVHQRVTELNKRILNGQTSLLNAKKSATNGTPFARALRGLAGLRQKQVVKTKQVKTRTKKAKKKALQNAATKSG